MISFIEERKDAVKAVGRTPVVLVHGWAGSAESWNPVLAELDPESWDTIALRLPGSPGSPPADATIPAATERLIGVLEALPSRALVVGHSMGAQVTLRAHVALPQRVLGEVVIDPAYGGELDSRDEMARWATRIQQDGLGAVTEFFRSATDGLSPDLVARVLEDLERTSPAVIASYLLSEYVDEDAIGLMPATATAASGRRLPVLSLHSTDASAMRESSLPTTPGSESHIWHGHGHYLHLEDPSRFAALLTRWRDRLLGLESPDQTASTTVTSSASTVQPSTR